MNVVTALRCTQSLRHARLAGTACAVGFGMIAMSMIEQDHFYTFNQSNNMLMHAARARALQRCAIYTAAFLRPVVSARLTTLAMSAFAFARPAVRTLMSSTTAAAWPAPRPRTHGVMQQRRAYASEAKASELKVNNFIEYMGKVWQVHSITRSAQGAQRSVLIMTELKEYKTGRKDLVRFDQEDAVSVIRFDTNFADFLYKEGDVLYVMNPDTFEQYEIPAAQTFGSAAEYLVEGMRLSLFVHEGAIMRAEMPQEVAIEIKTAEQRSSDSAKGNKKATLVNGRTISVPGHIQQGQLVWVRPLTDEFVRKAN